MSGQKPKHEDSNAKTFVEGDSAPESENDDLSPSVDVDKEQESIHDL